MASRSCVTLMRNPWDNFCTSFVYYQTPTYWNGVYTGQEPPEEPEPKFNPFTGVGRRLDGKGLKTGSPPVSSSAPQDRRANASAGGTGAASSSSSQTAKAPTQGKLVFGSNANRTKDAPKVTLYFPFLNPYQNETFCIPACV